MTLREASSLISEKCPGLLSENSIQLAYSRSKMTVVDEMTGGEKYMRMVFVEFLEFVARVAYLAYFEDVD